MQEAAVTPKKIFAASAILIIVALAQIGCNRSNRGEVGDGAQNTDMLEVGSAAPNFRLRNLDGRQVSLDQFRGKVVLLDFWATWCGPCRMTMPLMERLQKEFPQNMALLAINLEESAPVVRDYVREQNIDSEVLLDEDGAVGAAYGAEAIPLQVLIDKEGKLRRVQAGLSPSTIARLRAEIQNLSR
jgi:thiol-disulfide isomerase/thioredoxin